MPESVFEGTSLCKFFARGNCFKGSSCKFAHGLSALRAKPDLNKTKMCSTFKKMGTCNRGEECSFAHDRDEIRRGQKKKLSKAASSKADAVDDMPSPQHRSESMESTITSSTPIAELSEEEELFGQESLSFSLEATGVDAVEIEPQASDGTNVQDEEELAISVKNTFLHFEAISKPIFRSPSCPVLDMP